MGVVRRIGVMGGSFDPVHVAHEALAVTALSYLNLDEVRWVPVGQAWQKARVLTAAKHRLAMVGEVVSRHAGFVVDDLEIQRSGPSYTLDTLQALKMRANTTGQEAVLVLIIGQDQYANLPTWHGWQQILQIADLAVACRGDQLPQAPDALRSIPYRVSLLPLPSMNISSTDIRARLGQGDSPLSLAPSLLSEGVARYIANHQLYAPGAQR